MKRITQRKQQAAGRFFAHYKKSVLQGVTRLEDFRLEAMAKAIKETAMLSRAGGGTFYLLGNGGSCAMLHCFDLRLRNQLGKIGHIRTSHGVDYFYSQAMAEEGGYDDVFAHRLMGERAGPLDLVLLVSASGNSTNVVRARNYCMERYIPSISLVGFGGGELARRYGSRNKLMHVPIHDQQIVEDVMLSFLYLTPQIALKGDASEAKKVHLTDLVAGLEKMNIQALLEIAEKVVRAYINSKAVFVLAPQGGEMAVSAEHTAHNLNWDAVYGIENPPPRIIYSTPALSNYSGIANDRRMPGIVSAQELEKAKNGDVLVLYTVAKNDELPESVKNTLAEAEKRGMSINVISFDATSIAANLFQTVGHNLGRLVRALLKIHLGECAESDIESVLIGEDMAQRRLLGVKDGL
jgi:D-sedoheptulose 7-phosphate isomerase